MSTDSGILRSISWRDICPWLLLARVFRVAVRLDVLALATVGVLLLPLGWWISGRVFLPPDEHASPLAGYTSPEQLASWPGQWSYGQPLKPDLPSSARSVIPTSDVVGSTFLRISLPFAALFDSHLSLTRFAYLLAGNLWVLVVWAFCGGAIVRAASVQLGCDERIGLGAAVRHAARRFPAYVGGPLGLLLMTALAAILPAIAGLLLRVDALSPLAALGWPVVLLLSLVMSYCLLALLFGWPLMWGTLGAENSDFFDAISRSFSYTFQRPLHYLFYAAVAGFLGSLGWIVVYWFTEFTLNLAWWAASWGMGHARLEELQQLALNPAQAPTPLNVSLGLINLAEGVARSVAVGYTYAYLWSAAAGIYLLLRRDVDQREFDDVYLEGEEDDRQLPPLPVDAAGVPGAPQTGGAAAESANSPPAGEGAGPVAPQPE